VSLDEAYLDLTATERLHGAPPAIMLARLAKRVEDELGVTVSIGLSHAPYLAKIASDLEKPQGFSVIGKAETLSFLDDKPVSLIGGVGAKMEESLSAIGVRTIGQMRRIDRKILYTRLGESAIRLVDYANGIDRRVIEPNAPAKSLSAETTFEQDVSSRAALEKAAWPLCEKVSARAKKAGIVGGTVVLKLKTTDHQSLTRQLRREVPTQLAGDLFDAVRELLDKAPRGKLFRLIGVGIADLSEAGELPGQKSLFDDGSAKREAAERALDAIRARFGDKAAFKGRALK
jgi:DNA polymerase IV